MPVDQPSNIYRIQLSSEHHGLALWEPNPVEDLFKDPGHVSIGDVGYVDKGAFIRMFNVTLPWDHPSNRLLGTPEEYKPLKREHFGNVRRNEDHQEEYQFHVSKIDGVHANTHDEWAIVLSCTASIPLISSVSLGAWVKHMSARLGVMGRFCLFLMGHAPRMLSARKYSRTISEIMWTAGSAGQRRRGCPSSTWKTSFL